ncbi:hypothetical protein LPJ81_004453 [Coemansia sp. IMI 209127]|nr:hypothetical protein LPJ81_004453 [Coemansia sp. IMI 209127]
MDAVAGQTSSAVASTNDRKNLGVRRRSASDMKRSAVDPLDAPPPTDPLADDSNGTPDMWLNEELEALGELKRGAIAAQFPEEFNVDSDILNGASNVWLPARLHPEIAPGEFQEWLKKHGSQLSKMEDSVHRRKSILSYSYNNSDGTDDPQQPEMGMRYSTDLNNGDDALDNVDFSFGVGAGVRRRNTTGLVRRKTFIERADEEADEDAPFLVQGMQRSSLKRSKLANKRRDSTASRTGSGRRRPRNYDQSAPSVSSPLAPSTVDTADDDNDDETATNNRNGGSSADAKLSHTSRKQQHPSQQSRASAREDMESPDSRHPISSSFLSGQQQSLELTRDAPASIEFDADGKRMSTAEILKQVTAAVDNLGFDFEICDLDNYDDLIVPEPSAPSLASINSADDKQQQQPYQMPPTAADQEKPAMLERKSVTHKKSGSWWQWGRDDNATNGPSTSGPSTNSGEKDARPSMSLPNTIQRPKQQQQQPPQASANEPSSIKHAETMPAAPSSSLLKSKLPSPISFLRFNRKSKKDRRSSDGNQQQQQQQQPTGIVQPRTPSNAPQPSQTKKQPLGLGPGNKKQQQQGPPAASAPTSASLTASNSSQPSNAQQKRALKDTQANDDSGSTDTSSDSEGSSSNGAAQKSNIPSIITPVRPPPTRLATSSNRLPIHIERAIYRLASIKLANPRRPLLQQVLLSNMMFWYLELINPRSQQQQQQTQQPPSPQQAQQQFQQQQQQAQPEKQQKSPKMTQTQPQQTPPAAQQQPHQQQQQQQQVHNQHHQKQQQHRAPSPEVGGMNGHHSGATDKRGKQRGHKSRDNVNRRRSAGTNNASEHVVMRSPQYERQQQQIYRYPQAGSQQHQQQQQSSSPQMMPGGQSQQMKYNYQQPQQQMAGGNRSHSPVPSNHSIHSGDDEDDDVPLALYRGERNAMSIG